MAKNKFYAVSKGRKPGIYFTWMGADGAETQVSGFPGARYKGFPTLQEAQAWLSSPDIDKTSSSDISSGLSASVQTDLTAHGLDNTAEVAINDGKVVIYTDGGCSGNPGPGGYGVVLLFGEYRKELSGGYRLTTNNRMELTACIVALQNLKKRCAVVLHSDSRYVVDGIMKGWAKRWKANHWMRNDKAKAENADLWEKLLLLCEQHGVEFVWVRGHASSRENERCDQLSVSMTQRQDLPPDTEYEKAYLSQKSLV